MAVGRRSLFSTSFHWRDDNTPRESFVADLLCAIAAVIAKVSKVSTYLSSSSAAGRERYEIGFCAIARARTLAHARTKLAKCSVVHDTLT